METDATLLANNPNFVWPRMLRTFARNHNNVGLVKTSAPTYCKDYCARVYCFFRRPPILACTTQQVLTTLQHYWASNTVTWRRTQQVTTLLAQQCWELLPLVAWCMKTNATTDHIFGGRLKRSNTFWYRNLCNARVQMFSRGQHCCGSL